MPASDLTTVSLAPGAAMSACSGLPSWLGSIYLVETPGPLLPSAWLHSLPLPSGVDRAPSQEREMLSSVRKQ